LKGEAKILTGGPGPPGPHLVTGLTLSLHSLVRRAKDP